MGYLIPDAWWVVERGFFVYIVGKEEVRQMHLANDFHGHAEALPVEPRLAHVEAVAFDHHCALNAVHLDKQFAEARQRRTTGKVVNSNSHGISTCIRWLIHTVPKGVGL